tara:strand:+ start:19129 stop:20232 length:1104 start_codon:yes stop_codon:yes gene_type:complete
MYEGKKVIVVNATALRSGGALSILSQFIRSIEGDDEYLIFVHPSIDFCVDNESIRIVRIERTSFFSRIFWDSYGLDVYLKKEKIEVKVIISLQNTSIRITQSCEKVIYLHNIIPFVNYRWNLFKRSDFNLFLYRYIYSFFIFLYVSKNTHFIVQSEWFKNILIKRGVQEDRVLVARPEIMISNVQGIPAVSLTSNGYSIFYPATAHSYKNHIEIVNALIYMKRYGGYHSDITVYFTIDLDESSELYRTINENGLNEHFNFLGYLSFNDILSYYKSVNLVVFPSRLETFGLPLIEAAAMGKPILAIDMMYSREALQNYHNVSFCEFNDSKNWAEEILLGIKKNKAEAMFVANNGWSRVHQLINELKVC